MTPTQTLQYLTRRRLVQRDIRIRRIGKQIDRWSDRLEDTLLGILRRGRGGPEGVTGHLYVAANEAVDDLVVLFWREFGELYDWAHRSAAENMVRAVPMGAWVRRIMPAVPMLGVESRGGTVGVLEDFRDEIQVRRILDGETTDAEARAIVREIEFPPPSQLRANMIIRHAPWADGLEWPDRIKTKWAVDNRQLASELSQGYAAGENLDQLGTRLRKHCAEDQGINYKCKRLARTEGSRIAEEAQRDIYEQAGDLIEGIAAHNSQDGKVRQPHWRWQRPGAPPTIFRKQAETGAYIATSGEMAGEPLPIFPAGANCRCYSMPVLVPGLQAEMPPGAIAGQERFQASPEFVLNMPEKEVAKRQAAGRVVKKAAAEKVPKRGRPSPEQDSWQKAKQFAEKEGIYINPNDQETASAMLDALKQTHPEARKELQALGSSRDLKAWSKRAGVPKTSNLIEIDQTTGKAVVRARDFSEPGLITKDAAAETLPTPKGPVIGLNQGYDTVGKAAAKMADYPKDWLAGSTMKDTLVHELAHVEARVLKNAWPTWQTGFRASEDAQNCMGVWAQEFLKQSADDVAKQIGRYAATDAGECWAEVRVMEAQGKALPGWVKTAFEKMEIRTKEWGVLLKHDPWARPAGGFL